MTFGHELDQTVGTRTVFNGTEAEQMFHAEAVLLPELEPGEILVKVR
jgi:hypothetical protein